MFAHRKHVVLMGILALLAVGPICCGQDKTAPQAKNEAPPAMTAQERAALKQEVAKLNEQCKPFMDLFVKTTELVLPSVVSVSTLRTIEMQENPFERFFGPFGNPFENPFENPQQQPRQRAPQQQPREFRAPGLGSGFVVDAAQGYIVTNYHVVRDVKAEDITVTFSDGRELTVEKVVFDPRTDIAVLKVKPDGKLVALEWADGAPVKRGQWVLAVGSPMGFGSTVTSGIISAPSTRERLFGQRGRESLRANQDPFAVEDYIQTDAAINPGNSGGPLVDMEGRVLGLNTLIVSSTQSNAGLGFAVPTRLARPVVEKLISSGKVVRGYLGVSIVALKQIDDAAAQQLFGMKSAKEVFERYKLEGADRGVLVGGVQPNGPAEKGGVLQGDLILSVGDVRTDDVETLRSTVSSLAPGTKTTLALRRAGENKKLELIVAEQPSGEMAMAGGADTDRNEALGVAVQTLTRELAENLGFQPDTRGVIVVDLMRGGPAERAGIVRNDVILEVNRKGISNAAEFRDATKEIPARGVVFLVSRENGNQLIVVRPPAEGQPKR